MDEGKVFLIMMGVLAGAVVVFFIYNVFIKEALLKGKSIAGKAEGMLKKDLSSKCADCTFYMNNDYDNGYSQREWMDLYKERVSSKEWDKKSEEYAEAVAPFVNAIVVEGKYYMRRGMQNMEHTGVCFDPGVNDSISLKYFVEPYEYVKDVKRATLSELDKFIKKKEYEKNAPQRHAAYERCRNCIHERNCSITVRSQTGPCGGYTPKEKKNSFL